MKYLNLDPCPKCRNKSPTVNAIVSKDGRKEGNQVRVDYTVTCGCGMQSPIFKSKVEAVSWWNEIERREHGKDI